MRSLILRALLFFAGLAVSSVACASYGLASSFLSPSNPNRNTFWTAGSINAAGDPASFQEFTTKTMVGTVEVYGSAADLYPVAAYNTSAVAFVGFGAYYGPFETGLHPGTNGEYGAFRFTAPVTGTYNFSGDFHSVDTAIGNGDGVEVFIRLNSTDLSTSTSLLAPNQFVTTFGQSLGYDIAGLSLAIGQTVDILVSARVGYYFDATGVTANVTGPPLPDPPRLDAVNPEPASVTLLAAGIMGLGAWSVKKRRRTAAPESGSAAAV